MSKISKLLQRITMSSPRIGNAFLSKMKPGFFIKKSEQQSLQLFQNTVKSVPAYQKFLKAQGFEATQIKTIADFKRIPVIDKANYIKNFPLNERVVNSNLASAYAISASSGSTGKPTYWPRLLENDLIIPKVMDQMLHDLIQPKTLSTLVINTLGMGMWSAGDMATTGMRLLAAKKDYKITVAMPGLRTVDILNLIKDVASFYDQILLIGYPPFILDLIDEGIAAGINWSEYKPKIMMGGEGISEHRRQYLLDKIGSVRPYDVSNLFATSDAGIIGFETPLSIIVSKQVTQNKTFRKNLVGKHHVVSLVQYNPMAKYIEEYDGELLISSGGAVPLVRYNIHDRGKVFPYTQILELAEKDGINLEKEMQKYNYKLDKSYKLPFFAVFGRSDAIHFYAVNIYRENIMSILNNKELTKYVTGKFQMGVEEHKKDNQILKLKFELAKQTKISDKAKSNLAIKIQKLLAEVNSEYSELCKYLSQKSNKSYFPDIEFCENADPRYFKDYNAKHQYLM